MGGRGVYMTPAAAKIVQHADPLDLSRAEARAWLDRVDPPPGG